MDIGRLRKLIFSKGSFFRNSTGFGSLGELPQRSLAAKKASFRQLKALTEKTLAAESLFCNFSLNFCPDLNHQAIEGDLHISISLILGISPYLFAFNCQLMF